MLLPIRTRQGSPVSGLVLGKNGSINPDKSFTINLQQRFWRHLEVIQLFRHIGREFERVSPQIQGFEGRKHVEISWQKFQLIVAQEELLQAA